MVVVVEIDIVCLLGVVVPLEDESVLLVDADAPMSEQVALQRSQSVSRRYFQIVERVRGFQHLQFAFHLFFQSGRKASRIRASVEILMECLVSCSHAIIYYRNTILLSSDSVSGFGANVIIHTAR